MKLKELLAAVPNISLSISHPALDCEVKGLATNSHACQPGDLFLGMPGTRVDGGDFWQGAIASGAIAALVSPQAAQKAGERGSGGDGERGSGGDGERGSGGDGERGSGGDGERGSGGDGERGSGGEGEMESGGEGEMGSGGDGERGSGGEREMGSGGDGERGSGGEGEMESGGEGEMESGGAEDLPCIIPVADMTQACAHIATAFYGYPANKLKLVGVTGTNGKTTTTHLIEFILNKALSPTALFGTLYTRWPGFQETATHTTPFAVELQKQLAEAVEAGSQFGLMEVSSHALAQSRVLGCPFEVAVFTNLTQDHLDFHRDMEDYFNAKALLFSPDYLKGRAIVNADDAYGRRIIGNLKSEQVWSYSTSDRTADLCASDLKYEPNGVKGILHTPKGETAFYLPLVGQYNLSNLLAAVGAGLHLGLDLSAIALKLPEFPGVPGRVERVQISPDQDISAIVDYAHTPDSLENLLKASRPFIPGRMICVFGCGGDRDRTKRPKMGKIVAELSDLAVVTSDNPRTENPERILEDILTGIPPEVKPMVICDRAQAIRTAILEAQPGDGVLIAGKGHEDYQILGTEKIHFDDREQARDALKERMK